MTDKERIAALEAQIKQMHDRLMALESTRLSAPVPHIVPITTPAGPAWKWEPAYQVTCNSNEPN